MGLFQIYGENRFKIGYIYIYIFSRRQQIKTNGNVRAAVPSLPNTLASERTSWTREQQEIRKKERKRWLNMKDVVYADRNIAATTTQTLMAARTLIDNVTTWRWLQLTHSHINTNTWPFLSFSITKKKIFLYKLVTIVINAVLLDLMILKNVYFIFSMLK